MIFLSAAILVVLIAVLLLARPLVVAPRRRIAASLAITSALVGWVVVTLAVWGPSYRGVELTLDSTGQTSQRAISASLLEIGLDARLLAVIVALVLSFAILVIGGLAHAAKRRLGRWLMLASLVVPLAVASLSWGFAGLVLAVIPAVAATGLAFLGPGRSQISA